MELIDIGKMIDVSLYQPRISDLKISKNHKAVSNVKNLHPLCDKQCNHLRPKKRNSLKDSIHANTFLDFFESVPIGYFILSDTGIISGVNVAAADLLGIEKKVILKKPIAAFIHDQTITSFEVYLHQKCKSKELFKTNFFVGNNQWKTIYIQLMLYSNEHEYFLLLTDTPAGSDNFNQTLYNSQALTMTENSDFLSQDVTKLSDRAVFTEHNCHELIQVDKMASLGILISGIAHEINNPNNYVMLNSEIFTEAWYDSIPILEQYHKEKGDFVIGGLPFSKAKTMLPDLLNGMKDGTERIKKIVQSLKDYAREENEDISQIVNIHEVIDSAIIIMGNMIKKSTDNFSFIKGKLIPPLIGSPQKLEQVIINLLTNSCQALKTRDKLLRISTTLNASKDFIIITVKDEGKGIPKEHLSHVMKPFFTTKRDFGGTGLGLSISHSIIQAHKGTICITSQYGFGTTVDIHLPIASPEDIKEANS